MGDMAINLTQKHNMFFRAVYFKHFVSVLGREEGYTMKYGLSPREFPRELPRAQAMFHRISRLKS